LVNEAEGGFGVDNLFGGPQMVDDQLKAAGELQKITNGDSQLVTSALNSSDESHANYRTFKLMREMVQFWQYQFESKRDRIAEMMLEHFYRWLTSSNARMHDPALFMIIHNLMRKVFLQLLTEFKKIGSSIVYASFDKIVIATCKTSLPTAISYTRYAIDAIGKKPLYSHIDLVIHQFWDHLVWMDRYNFGGVVCENPDAVLEAKDAPVTVDGRQTVISLKWNIMDYLPPAVQTEFKKIIGQYIYEVHRDKVERRSKEPSLHLALEAVQESIDASLGDTLEADKLVGSTDKAATSSLTFLRTLISKHIKRHLLKVVPKMERRIHDGMVTEGEGSYLFPDLPGSHLEFKNPALEFIKTVCIVLELDKSVEREVRILKRDLLSLIGVREFSDEAKFVNPCEPFRLPHVICEYCNLTRDLDLTRDPDLLPIAAADAAAASTVPQQAEDADDQSDDNEPRSDDEMEIDDDGGSRQRQRKKPKRNSQESAASSVSVGPREWLCTGCGTEYDRKTIELQLVDIASRRLVAWQLQDLKCKRCRLVKAENIRDHCECSGQYATELSRADFIRRMRVFANIARFYRMDILKEIVEWSLNMC
jgi:DNA polymerase epsilon subunit 1